MTSTVLFSTLLISLCSCARTHAGSTVFKYNEGGWPCTRIPSVILASNRTLLAFAECRDRVGDGCVPKHPIQTHKRGCVCMKRSTDGGMTWSTNATCIGTPGSTQPLAVFDAVASRVVLHFNDGDNHTVFQRTSDDDGVTWSAATPLQRFLGIACARAHAGPGRGLQLSAHAGSSGETSFAGRLVMVGWVDAYPKPSRHDCVWYSDDHAVTWTVSRTTIPLMNEAQVAEVLQQAPAASTGATEVYFNSRTRGTAGFPHKPSECRAIARSSDGGSSFTLPVVWDQSLPEPGQGCQASVLGLPVLAPSVLLFSNPHAHSRTNMTIRRSTDGGRTWTDGGGVVVHKGGSAYSCLTELPDSRYVGVLHERDANDTSFCKGPSCQTQFSVLPLNF